MRVKFAVLLVLLGGAALLLGPNQALTQPGRGFPGSSGGFGPGGFDPAARFDQYANGRGFFLISEITDASRRDRMMQFAQQNGITDGKMTRDQYVAYVQQAMSGRGGPSGGPTSGPSGSPWGGSRGSFGGPSGGSPGGMMGGDPNDFFNHMSGGRDVVRRSDITDPMMGMIFDRIAQQMGISGGEISRRQFTDLTQQFMAMRSGSGSGGPGGEDSSDRRFRERDRNGDGMLNYDEMSDTLKAERDRWDANGDGFIDLNEYRAYTQGRQQQWQQQRGGDPNQGARGGSGFPDGGLFPLIPPLDEDKKPTVYRAGQLPNNLPPWFKEYDKDQDGQVGLYEWKNSGKSFDEFAKIDRNGDGFVTIDEMLRHLAQPNGNGPSSPMANRTGGRGPGGGSSGRDAWTSGNSNWPRPGGGPNTGSSNSNWPRPDGGPSAGSGNWPRPGGGWPGSGSGGGVKREGGGSDGGRGR